MNDTNLAKGRRWYIRWKKGGIGKKNKRVKRSTRRTNAPRYATRTSNSGKRVSFSFPRAPHPSISFSRARLDVSRLCVVCRSTTELCFGQTAERDRTTSVCQMFEQNVCRFLWTPPGPN